MGKIKQMSDSLANQIAAGEVVERPASVVKELLENSIDAESQIITVELIEAGIQRIQVTDDGIGMDHEDLKMAFMPHATSKIYELPDLFRIQSLGFRGEALASIASVSKVQVESMSCDQQEAHFIKVEGSKIIDTGITKARKGTTITVDSLFYNTPARLKHLKTIQTELKHIIQFVQNIALAYPNIRFTLINDNQKLFSTVGSSDLRQTIANVYQPSIARQLVPIQAEDTDFSIEGYISPPTLTRTNKSYMHWIINGRAVNSYMLDRILTKTYGRQLMIGRYPMAIIHIKLDSQLVDVNVHPTKQTVRLSKEEELGTLLQQAVNKALNQSNPVPIVDAEDVRNQRQNQYKDANKVEEVPFDFSLQRESKPHTQQTDKTHYHSLYNALNSQGKIYPIEDSQTDASLLHQDVLTQEAHDNFEDTYTEDAEQNTIDFTALRYVGQIHGTYLIAESEIGFYLIDQHAAQERLRYEQFMQEEPETMYQQQLLMPLIFNFTPAEMVNVAQSKEPLEKLGIYLDQFGPTSYQLESYPNWIHADEVEKIIRDLTELIIDQPTLTIPQIKEASIIMQSCRGAIKANHYLDKPQAIALIESMADLRDPYHCPHGRPVFVEFNQNTLEKLFKRIQEPHEGGTVR